MCSSDLRRKWRRHSPKSGDVRRFFIEMLQILFSTLHSTHTHVRAKTRESIDSDFDSIDRITVLQSVCVSLLYSLAGRERSLSRSVKVGDNDRRPTGRSRLHASSQPSRQYFTFHSGHGVGAPCFFQHFLIV